MQPTILSAAAPSQTVLSLSYDFHLGTADNGNVYAIQNNRDTTRSTSYSYDALNRIATAGTSQSTLWGQSFGYDPWGNLLSETVTQGTALPLSVTASGQNRIAGFCYDAAGNLTGQTACPNSTYVYDAENRLKSTAGVTYSYDGDGKRVAKSNGKLYWTGMGSDPLDESDAAGTINEEYVFFGGKRIARLDLPSTAVHFYFSDHLGSADVVTSAAGAIEQESDYYPFGGERGITAGPNNYKFTGKERDSESGLDNFGARYDASSLGRFMTPDIFWKDSHAGDPQSWNKYAYSRNNPLRYVDPTGENATVTTSCTTANNQTTCDVHISASIAIYADPGSGITQNQLNAAAATMQSSIQNAWTGSFQQDGVTYNVSTEVAVSAYGSQSAAANSGAQNVIGMTNGPIHLSDGRVVGAYVDPKTPGRWLVGGPDTGKMDINGVANYSKHEFTHFLGTGDKPGAVLSNTQPSMRPAQATGQDYQWGIQEAVSAVNNWVNAPQSRPMRYGEVWYKPEAFGDRTNVGAPLMWWK